MDSSSTSPYSRISLTPEPSYPVYPTDTPFNVLPDCQEMSEKALTMIMDLLLDPSNSEGLSTEKQDAVSDTIKKWASILKDLGEVHTPIPEPVPIDRKFWAPRYGDRTYAFTRECVKKAFQKHGEIAQRLNTILSQEKRGDLKDEVEEILEESTNSWRFISMAYASDQANEVSGTSSCYGF